MPDNAVCSQGYHVYNFYMVFLKLGSYVINSQSNVKINNSRIHLVTCNFTL